MTIIRLKSKKDIKINDIVLIRKNSEVSLSEHDDTYRVYCPYYDLLRECDSIASLVDYRVCHCKRYEVEKNGVTLSFYAKETAAKEKRGFYLYDYFVAKETDMKLTAENVERVHNECAPTVKEKFVCVNGIKNNYIYDKDKIEMNKPAIKSMLSELPETFRKSKGGGWSFLNMCMTKADVQWTGLHVTMEKLMLLGMAAGLVEYLLPEKMWCILPGGMPYIAINDEDL